MNVFEDLIRQLTDYADGLESWQQIGALVLFGMIPFIESHLGSFVGTLVGIDPIVAISAAVIGNIVTTFLMIALAGGVRGAVTRGRGRTPGRRGEPMSKRKQRVAKYFDRLGVPGVSLFSAFILPTQVTAPTLVALGARKGVVYVWMGIAIVVWGIAFGLFGDVLLGWYN
jgi:uncharacterized membrane protein